jgi:hypothetical protein
MPRKARPKAAREERPVAKTPFRWNNIRELWDWASSAEMEIERSGRKVTIKEIWRLIRDEGPEECKVLDMPPEWALDALKQDGYRQLVDIRKRMLVLPAIKDLGIIKELCGQAAYMALNSAMEDLIRHPERIETKEKRQLANTFATMYQKIAKPEEPKGETATETTGDAAADEMGRMEAALANIPEEYQEQMREVWRTERAKQLRSGLALHLVEDNRELGHAKAQ